MPHTRTPLRTRSRLTARGAFAAPVAAVLAAALLAPAAAATPEVGARDGLLGPLDGTEGTDYVALGDSYSAGPLIPAQRADPVGCLRSTNSYPAYLAGYFHVDSYTDVTCSGARSSDMERPQQTIVPGPPPPPQLEALSTSTDLVTLGIGGNDYGLFGSLIDTCQRLHEENPRAYAPCRDHFTKHGVDTKKRDARRIRAHIARVVRLIEQRAPEAQVYVVGYPRILPTRGTCDAVPFAPGDYRWGNQVERVLNRSIRRGAERNGATYVDLWKPSRGHSACAEPRREAWINGAQIKPYAANFHPFRRGMRGMARAIYSQIAGLPAPGYRFARPPLTAEVLNTGAVLDLVSLLDRKEDVLRPARPGTAPPAPG